MMDYFICIILLIVSSVFYYLLGKVFDKKNQDFSYRYILGYFVFTFFASIPGIIVQALDLSWYIYFVYYLLLIIALCILIINKLKINRLFDENEIVCIGKENYFLVIITVILVLISFLYIWLIWANNHSDDGYYIGKIAEYPYMINPFTTNPVSGFTESNISSYTVNTWELQASVFPFLFKINPIIYVRFYLNFTNFFLIANVIKGLGVQIVKRYSYEKYESSYRFTIQYICLVLLMFSFNSSFYDYTKLITTNDLWQFNAGVYLASSLVRVVGLPILLMFFLNRSTLRFQDIILAIVLSVGLISKSTIALPVLVIFALIYFLLTIPKYFKKKILVYVLMISFLMLVSIVLSNNIEIENLINGYLVANIKSILFIFIIIVVLSGFLFKEESITKINIILLLIAMFMFVNPINNIFESSSIFVFVAGRMHTNYIYLLMIVATIYVYLFFYIWIKSYKVVTLFSIASLILMTFGSYKSFSIMTGSLRDSYSVLYRNKELIPKSTMNLSMELNEISKEKELIAICPSLPMVNGKLHTLGVNLRFWAPNIKIVTNLIRYGNTSEEASMYKDYTQDIQDKFNEFSINPMDSNASVLDIILQMGNVNCFIVESSNAGDYLEYRGFELRTSVQDIINSKDYFVYVK